MVDRNVNIDLDPIEITEIQAGLEHQVQVYEKYAADNERINRIQALKDRLRDEEKETIKGNRGFLGKLKSRLW